MGEFVGDGCLGKGRSFGENVNGIWYYNQQWLW